MSIRVIPFVQEEFYHIYNRGNSKQVIFHDKEDMDRFLCLLYISNTPERFETRMIKNKGKALSVETKGHLVAIGAYCLMPNHFHILITQLTDGGISKFMQKLSTAYAMYYNKKYKHTGGLYEGKFKAKHINNDIYLKYLFSYIHLNPVKLIDPTWKENGIRNVQEALAYLRTYAHSSYLDFLHEGDQAHTREEKGILNLDMFPKYFPTRSTFEREIISWFALHKDI